MARLADLGECPPEGDAGALVADRGGELAAIIAEIPEPISPRRLAEVSLQCIEVELRLPSACGSHDQPERLPDPFSASRIVPRLAEIKFGQRAKVADDPIRVLW